MDGGAEHPTSSGALFLGTLGSVTESFQSIRSSNTDTGGHSCLSDLIWKAQGIRKYVEGPVLAWRLGIG